MNLPATETEQPKVSIPSGVDLKDVFPLVEKARVGPDATLEVDAEVGLVDGETAEVGVGSHLRATSGADFDTAGITAAAALDPKSGAGLVAALSGTV